MSGRAPGVAGGSRLGPLGGTVRAPRKHQSPPRRHHASLSPSHLRQQPSWPRRSVLLCSERGRSLKVPLCFRSTLSPFVLCSKSATRPKSRAGGRAVPGGRTRVAGLGSSRCCGRGPGTTGVSSHRPESRKRRRERLWPPPAVGLRRRQTCRLVMSGGDAFLVPAIPPLGGTWHQAGQRPARGSCL